MKMILRKNLTFERSNRSRIYNVGWILIYEIVCNLRLLMEKYIYTLYQAGIAIFTNGIRPKAGEHLYKNNRTIPIILSSATIDLSFMHDPICLHTREIWIKGRHNQEPFRQSFHLEKMKPLKLLSCLVSHPSAFFISDNYRFRQFWHNHSANCYG